MCYLTQLKVLVLNLNGWGRLRDSFADSQGLIELGLAISNLRLLQRLSLQLRGWHTAKIDEELLCSILEYIASLS